MKQFRSWKYRRVLCEQVQKRRREIVCVKSMGLSRSALFLMFGTIRPTNSEIEYAIFGNNLNVRRRFVLT